jgi:hypothetical protein
MREKAEDFVREGAPDEGGFRDVSVAEQEGVSVAS